MVINTKYTYTKMANRPPVISPYIGGGAYWAVARPSIVPNWQALLLAVPLFCVQIDFFHFMLN